MAQDNVELVIQQFDRTNARDFAGVMDTWADAVTLILHGDFVPFAYVYTVREGKICRVEVWADREAALEAVALSE